MRDAREGRGETARAELRSLRDAGAPRAADADFLAGYLAFEAGDTALALEALGRVAGGSSILRGYAAFWLARVEERRGRAGEALRLRERLGPGSLPPHLLAEALAASGETLRDTGRPEAAAAAWREAFGLAVTAEDRAEMALRLGRLHEGLARPDSAQDWYARAAAGAPLSPAASIARGRARALASRGGGAPEALQGEELARHALLLARARRWGELDPLLARMEADGRELLRGAARLLRAQRQAQEEGEGSPARARAEYLAVARALGPAAGAVPAAGEVSRAREEFLGEAWHALVRSYADAGEADSMKFAWRSLREQASGAEACLAATSYAAETLRAAGEVDGALAMHRAWLADHPAHPRRSRMLWEMARSLVLERRWSDAVPATDSLVAQGDPELASWGMYWGAQALGRSGDTARAQGRLRLLERRYPLSYHAHRARLEPRGDGGAWPRGVGATLDESSESDRAWAWLERNPPQDLRVAELTRLGLTELAFRDLFSASGGSDSLAPATRWTLLALGTEAGLWDDVLRLVRTHCREELLTGRSAEPALLWTAAYPRPFRPGAFAAAARAGLDPHLVWAIAREESNFQSRVSSHAGAQGVMQLMPETARELWRRVEPDSARARPEGPDLHDPAVSLLLGARYVADLVKRWPGNLAVSLAAYNAGPARASRWTRELPGTTPDEFAEAIPFRETRLFVRGVLRAYYEYRRLYGGGIEPVPPDELAGLPATSSPSTPSGTPAR